MSITEVSVRKRTAKEQLAYDMGYQMGKHDAVRHGRWVSRFPKHWKGKDECGECGFHEKDHRDLSHYKYCPNCGAMMDAKNDDEQNMAHNGT